MTRDATRTPLGTAVRAVQARSAPIDKVDFGIITIREDELAAVLQRFPDKLRTVSGHRRYRIRRLRLSPTEDYTVAVLRCVEQGNGEAQAAARDLLEDLAPRWILVVGIAGGVPAHEFSLGDVIISNRIADFSVEAVLKDHSREYALAGGPLHPDAAKFAADIRAMTEDGEIDGWNNETAISRPLPPVEIEDDKFYGDNAWKQDVREKIERRFHTGPARPPLATTGAIGSSDRLIKDAEILQVWLKVARQVQAVEMESAGVYRATHARQVPFLSIRGISDVVGFKRHPDWTEYACHSAAAFTLAFLRARPIEPRKGAAEGTEPDDVAAAALQLQTANAQAAQLNVIHKRVQILPNLHKYRLVVCLSNAGNEKLSNWHIDVELPAKVFERCVATSRYLVAQRSTPERALFRISSEGREAIFPGDAFMEQFDYSMNDDLYRQRCDLFEQEVAVTAYVNDAKAATYSVRFEELQEY